MDGLGLRVLTIAGASAAALAIASSAQACESCVPDPSGNPGEVCWSANTGTGGSCTGGYGVACQVTGTCADPPPQCSPAFDDCNEWSEYWCMYTGDCS